MSGFPTDAAVLAVLRALSVADTAAWAPVLADACRRHGIDTPARLAAFLGNAYVESGGLSRLVENLNYSVDGLLKTFGRHRISEEDCRALGRKPGEKALGRDRQRAIALRVYGGAWGWKNLGNRPNTTDAADYIGRGLLQLTGLANYRRFADAIGVPVEALPMLLETREGAADSAARYWIARGINACADCGDITGARRLVNGGAIGLADVQAATTKAAAGLARSA